MLGPQRARYRVLPIGRPLLRSTTAQTPYGEAQNTHTNMTNFKVKDARGTGVG